MRVWRSTQALNNPDTRRGKHRRDTKGGRARAGFRRELLLERFEDRLLLAGPQLISIVPNDGDVLLAGQTRHTAPQELTFRFNEGQVIDPATLGGIQIVRAGADRALGTADDIHVIPGFRGIGDRPSEVVFRFAETLSDDRYRITIQSTGPNALFNIPEQADPPVLPEPFDPAGPVEVPLDFRLDLAPQVLAVVPQPITRNGSGALQQAVNEIDVYFNDDDLRPLAIAPSNLDPNLFQLIFTNDTLTTTDDQRHVPDSVSYDPVTDKAVLTFAAPLGSLGTGAFRLRIGNDDLPLSAPSTTVVAGDPGSTFGDPSTLPFDAGAFNAGHLNADSQQIFKGAIETQPIHPGLLFPGGINEAGHRDIPAEAHLGGEDSSSGVIPTIFYNFQDVYGTDPNGNILHNVITEAQKQRAREVFQLYSYYLGVQFLESPDLGFTVATGDIRAVSPTAPPTAVAGIAGGGVAIVNALFDWGESEYGGGWFGTAMHEIGHLLGLGHSFELPPTTVQGTNLPNLAAGTTPEPAFPGNHDIVHGQHLFRRDSKDIDVYKFVVTSSGTFTAETTADRQPSNSSLLDSLLTLYSEVNVIRLPRTGAGPVGSAIVDGHRFTIDDGIAPAVTFEFDSNGSVFETATLKRIAFSPSDSAHDVAKRIADAVNAAAAASGVKVEATVQLDRVVLSGPILVTPIGSQGQISYVIDREVIARNDDYFSKDSLIELELGPGRYYVAVTSTGNGDFDPNVPDSGFGGTTQGAYDLRLGFRPTPTNNLTDRTNTPLNIGGDDFTVLDGDADGVPGGVHNFWFQVGNTLFVDKQGPATPAGPLGSLGNPYRTIDDAVAAATAGSIVRIVGNGGTDGRLDTPADAVAYQIGFDQFNTPLPDGSDMQVPQGVTVMIDAGAVIKLRSAIIDVGSSAQGIDRGEGALQVLGAPVRAGSPGNVAFTSFHDNDLGGVTDFPGNDLPASQGDWGGLVFRDDSDREDQGIFFNYVNQARIRFGGGQVNVEGVAQVYNPVHMVTARPTVTYNTITESADAAMSADPNSFEDTRFGGATFTSDYDRRGPHIRGNRLSVQLPRVITAPLGSALSDGQTFVINNTVFEFDDADPADNALGVAPGNVAVRFFSVDSASQIATKMAAAINGAGIGVTAAASGAQVSLVNTFSARVSAPLSLSAAVLDNSVNGLFVRTRSLAGQEPEVLEVAARWDDADIVHVVSDNLFLNGSPGGLDPNDSGQRGRDSSLTIDPGLIVKLLGSRIEVEMGATLYAEGTAGDEVIFTSQRDDRYGAGGTFDTNGDNSNSTPASGDWGGFYFSPTSRGSLDHALITFGGGRTTIEGGFNNFNAVEIRQADVRIANSVLETNAEGLAELSSGNPNRAGRLANDAATVYVLGAQPVLLNNVFRNNLGATISIDANSLESDFQADYGRGAGPVDDFDQFDDNHGPLIRLNRIGNVVGNAAINAMVVRGATLNIESVWDDVDIVHVLFNEIAVPNFHTYGGLRLQSSSSQSLVVKLQGDAAGFTATGTPLDINDRIGGSVQIVGAPGHPVVLTALADDSVGAGLTPDGEPQDDTNNDGDSDVPGDSGPVFPPSGGELTVTTTTNATTLVNGMLLRPLANGVTINSATYTGGTVAAGTYINGDGVPLEILQVGTIITTGDANLPTSNTSPGFTGVMGTAGDADLDALIASTGFTTDEAAILTITFTVDPASGIKSGRFNFQFGSDEFSEFVGSPFNDVLGGFINGGPSTNFMRDSQGNLVSINSAFFDLDNEATPFLDIEYDGMTSGLLAQFPVQPGVNTLKIAIADVSDRILDSGILLTDLRFSQQNVGSGGVGRAEPESGTWRSVRLDKYSNDRNVAVVNESEESYTGGLGTNDSPAAAQALGELAPDEKSGDDNRRLGFEIHGQISLDDPGDVDVYTFKARGGTEIWLDIDRTSHSLDTILELVDANGTVLARSNDSVNETAASLAALLPGNLARVMQRDVFLNDVYGSANLRDYNTTNPRDAGMRLVLPGPAGAVPNTYYVRVRSSGSNLNVLNGGQSQGAYQLQVRLRELDEVPGSTVRYADVRFATNGIEILGLPAHSPLAGETGEEPGDTGDEGQANAQNIGNLLTSDKNTISVAGSMVSPTDVDWYQFTIDYDLIQSIGGINSAAKTWATIFDIDYADGLARPDTIISVFDSSGRLILTGRDSDVAEDQPRPPSGSSASDLTRSSFGKLDPFIGSAQLPEGPGRTYFVAVHSNLTLPTALNATFQTGASQSLIRLEPITGVGRLAESHVDFNDGQTAAASTPLFNTNSIGTLNAHATPFTLSDVTLFVVQSGVNGRLFTVDPFTGRFETNIGDPTDTGFGFNDIVMRNDGRLFAITVGNNDANSGSYREINTGDGSVTVFSDDGIVTNQFDNAVPPAVVALNSGIQFQAYAFVENETDRRLIAIGRYPGGNGVPATNLLFELNPNTGVAFGDSDPNAQKIETNPRGSSLGGPAITGLASVGGSLFAVNNAGDLFQVNVASQSGFNPVGAGLIQIANFGVSFTGLTAGPRNVENGRFVNTLFATASDGRMYAFNTSGQLQAIFDANGDGIAESSSIALGVGGVVGLQFSTLDYNLWHVTDRRELEAGHGINQSFDNSRNRHSSEELQGGTSFYFGFEDPRVPQTITTQPGARNYLSNTGVYNSYDFPGGAYGSLTTNTFDLRDYSRTDKPTLYFNYFLTSQNANSRTDEMRDSARVFISNDGVTWHMVTTNNSVLATRPFSQDAELPQYLSTSSNTGSGDARQRIQELFDNTVGWRQARADLGDFAGQSNLRLRFDFSTAADISDPSSPGNYRTVMPGDGFGNFSGNDRSRERGQNNRFEGFYVDDIIVGFAERGEMITGATANTTFFNVPQNPDPAAPVEILTGSYQLEIRRGAEYGANISGVSPDIFLFRAFDTNDRLNESFKLIAPAGNQIANGQTFRISDGLRTVTFEFRNIGAPTPGNVAINFTAADSPAVLAGKIRTAINNINNPAVLDVSAAVLSTSNRIDLVHAADVINGSMPSGVFSTFRLQYDLLGDENLHREQGQIVIDSSRITNSLNFGVVVDAGARDAGASLSHPGVVRNLSSLNSQRLLPGATISNNLITGGGQGGVLFSGDPNASGPLAGVPFGRVVNNTIFGNAQRIGTGIRVTENASPTILNNIFANLDTGIEIDATSATTVVGGSVYQNNGANKTGGGPESFSFALSALEPLFRDAVLGNFYLAAGSKAIDSSVQSLPERSAMTAAKSLTGIPGSPILAPDFDINGLLRLDDPNSDPLGLGSSVFKDRGALERADFAGPVSVLINPRDNDLSDQNPAVNVVHRLGESIATFAVQLVDAIGSGIDDLTVLSSRFVVRRNGILLRPGIEYTFSYDSNNDIAFFTSAAGVWLNGNQYTISLDNGVKFDRLDPSTAPVGIRDLAGNLLQANGPNGFTEFNILLDSVANDAPVIHVRSPQSVNEDAVLAFTAANGNLITIFDVDAGTNPINVTLITAAVHTLQLGSIPAGVTVLGNNTNSINLVGPLADINLALASLTFTPSLNFNGPATIEITANDMGNFPPPAMAGSATLEINVLPVNDAPINTVPGPQSLNEDTSLTFSAANGNAISIADIDITGNQSVRVTLTAADGTLTLNGTAGLAFTAGDGSADATMTFSGSIAALNAALNGLLYVPPPSFSGDTSIQIVTNDLGNIGIGGPLTDTDTITLTVVGRNDPPIVANPIANVTVNEDAPPTVLNLTGVFTDVDIPPDPPLVLSVQANTNPSLLTASLVGTTLRLTYAANQNGTAFITIRATDSFGASVSTTFRVTVGPVQDPPSTANDQYVYEINSALTVAAPGVLANDSDPDGDPLTAVLFDVPDHGMLTLNPDGSFTYLPDTNFRGRDSFVYKSDDGTGNRAAATVVLNSLDSRWVERMYTEVLGRPGATAIGDSEINFWVGRLSAGMSRLAIAEAFITSTERRSVVINQLYQTYLGRSVDGPGLSFWLGVWNANRGPERVQAGIIASFEFFNTAGGTPQAWVQALYQNLLGRSAGPEEIAFWAPLASNPQTREAVVMGFVTSDEYRLILIRDFYTTFLRRPIDTAGANFWLQQMRNGLPQETILAGILASDEFRLRN